MATETDNEINGCTFLWKIENISHWSKNGCLYSPTFVADALEDTKWHLSLESDFQYFFKVYFIRYSDGRGPKELSINYQIALKDKDGRFFNQRPTSCFIQAGYLTPTEGFAIEKIFKNDKERCFSEDTLTVQFTMWKGGEMLRKSKLVTTRTIFKVEKRSFLWKILDFSSLKDAARNKFKENGLIYFDLVLIEGLGLEKKLVMDIVSVKENVKHFSFKISLINSNGVKEEYGTHEYLANDLKKGMRATLLSLKRVTLNKSLYLPNDILSLDCEYTYSTGAYFYEHSACGELFPNVKNVVVEKGNDHCIEKEKTQQLPVFNKDLKSMLDDGIFSDTKLRTSTKTFPAHKCILMARSPVFRKMFSNDMKETLNGYVDITDLEDDTLYRMLLYIYTDFLEDLQFESALELYVAADKYEILPLKSICSSFLKNNICLNEVCNILILADQHQDEDLKTAAQDYILDHDEVFNTEKWKSFMITNAHAAADTMYRKIRPN